MAIVVRGERTSVQAGQGLVPSLAGADCRAPLKKARMCAAEMPPLARLAGTSNSALQRQHAAAKVASGPGKVRTVAR